MDSKNQDEIERPFSVTILLVFVLCITAWNGIRVWSVVQNWDLLTRFRGNPVYIATTGVVWFIVGLGLCAMFVKGHPIAARLAVALSLLYSAWYWLDRLTIQISPASNLLFSLVASVILYSIFITLLLWPSSRAFFSRR